MKPEPPPLQVAKPCPKDWNGMAGDAKRRFCEHCQLHVHNLSAMQPGERAQFVAESRGQACITYELRPDGTMVSASRWDWVLRPMRAFAALLAALLPFAFSSCATRRTAGVPAPQGGLGAQLAKKDVNYAVLGTSTAGPVTPNPGNAKLMGKPTVPKAQDR